MAALTASAISALQTPPATPAAQTGLSSTLENSPSKQPDLLQKFAVARLKHNVSELEEKVEHDRRNQPVPAPKPTTLHLVPDASALTTSISDIKAYVAEESAKVTVPLCVLDALDALKRGSETENLNARETVRWFDRTLPKSTNEKGVRMQAPEKVYGTWEECLEWYNPVTSTASDDTEEISFTSPLAMTESQMLAQTTDGIGEISLSPSPPGSPTLFGSAPAMPPRILKPSNTFTHTNASPKQLLSLPRSATTPMRDPPSPTLSLHAPEVPRRIQPIINCALEILHSEKTEFSKKSEGVVFLITNNPETSHWAKSFGIPVLNTKELHGKIAEEKRLYKQKKRDWDITQNAKNGGNGRHGGPQHGHAEPIHVDANDFRRGEGPRAKNQFNPSAGFQGGRGGGRGGFAGNNENNNGGGNRRRNRNNQNARGGAATGGNGNRGGRGGFQGANYGRNTTVSVQDKETNGRNVFGTSPESFRGHSNHGTHNNVTREFQVITNSARNTTGGGEYEPEFVLGRGANRGVARGKGKLWIPS